MKVHTIRLWGTFFLFSFCCLFLFSPDSYTHDLVGHFDSAWFFTCGKAWMNGLTPYVDFADSKGPLLWFIYGLGYLISSHSYIGVFWISVIFYTGIFYFTFKTANIFLNDKKKSFAVVLLMTGVYFCTWYHQEIRAEDWCHLFIAISIYRTCHLLYNKEGMTGKEIYKTCFLIGLCLTGTLLIKFNVTAMLGVSALYILYVLIRERKNILLSFMSVLAGFITLTLPFFIYMMTKGCFYDFIQEYFLNTMQTVQSYNSIGTYLHEWLFLTYDPHYVVLFSLGCLGAYNMASLVKTDRLFFAISFLGFYAVSIHHSSFLHWHYLSACMFFIIWICISYIYTANPKAIRLATYTVCIYTFISNFFTWGYLSHNWFFNDNIERKGYYEAAYYTSQVSNSTILYYLTMDNGQGIPAICLPATRYWALQSGATDNMIQDQINTVKNRKADFVVANNKSDSLIVSSGYHFLCKYRIEDINFCLFTKHDLNPLPSNFVVNKSDILLKRNLFKKIHNYDCQ